MMSQADRLLEGAIDLHCHVYPEISLDLKKRVEDLEAAQLAAQAGMKGLVLKSHMWPTVGRVYQIRNQIKGVEVWPGMALNTSAGGFSPWTVESGLRQGVKVIWMPTWSAKNDIQRGGFSRLMKGWLTTINQIQPEDGLTVFNDSGEIDRKVKEILALAKEYDVAVSTGHLSSEEGLAIAREAQKMGFKKLIFCHPDSKSIGAEMEHIQEMARMNFFVEFTFLGLLPAFWRISIQEVARRIKEIGAERSVLTTDAFFEWTPPPPEMMRMFISSLLTQGITGEEIEMMVRKNPGELLNV